MFWIYKAKSGLQTKMALRPYPVYKRSFCPLRPLSPSGLSHTSEPSLIYASPSTLYSRRRCL